MPRLLLVDDNPSIHKIAETLLGSSPIELVCVGSASEAMMLLDSGERFDIALLDTAMPGMDGWELLARMRKHPDSAFIPIAMMAGVLDTVDPEKLKHAPIQGFIKKPIELRELAERVQQLLATPVTLGEPEETEGDPTVLSPFATVPGTKIKSLPEFRGITDGPPTEAIGVPESQGLEIIGGVGSEGGEDDLLLLTPEDFWFEEAPMEVGSDDFLLAQATAQALAKAQDQPSLTLAAPMDATLDLEELDLEALKDLPNEEPSQAVLAPFETTAADDFSVPEPSNEAFLETTEEPMSQEELADDRRPAAQASTASGISINTGELLESAYEEETLAIPGLAFRAQALSAQAPVLTDSPAREFLTEDNPAQELSDLGDLSGLEDFKSESTIVESPDSAAVSAFESQPQPNEAQDDMGFPSAAAYALPVAAMAFPAMAAFPAAGPEPSIPSIPVAPNVPTPVLGAPAESAPVRLAEGATDDAAKLVQALMSDPVMMDALARAVVAKLGDQALREIAWELMPELAEKLPR